MAFPFKLKSFSTFQRWKVQTNWLNIQVKLKLSAKSSLTVSSCFQEFSMCCWARRPSWKCCNKHDQLPDNNYDFYDLLSILWCKKLCMYAHSFSQFSAPECISSAHKLPGSSGFQTVLLSESKVHAVVEVLQQRPDTMCTFNDQSERRKQTKALSQTGRGCYNVAAELFYWLIAPPVSHTSNILCKNI